jgi:hypothetical protein
VLGSRENSFVHFILIRVKCGLLLIQRGNLLLQGYGALATAVADVKSDDLASRGVPRNLAPLAGRFGADKAPELIHFGLSPRSAHGRGPAGD